MEQVEVWKDIPDYEGIYQASNLGRIRTAPNKKTYSKLHGERTWKCRILKGRGDNIKTGKRVSLWKDGKVKDWLVARLVAITFLGQPTKEYSTVNHINGNRLDNNIKNLEWLSLGDNIRHAFNTGLMPYKKVKLFNKNSEMIFRSMAMASLYLGRSHSYISNCLKKKRNIISSDGKMFSIKFIDNRSQLNYKAVDERNAVYTINLSTEH